MTFVRQVPLGSTGLTVSRVGLGTAALGGLYQATEDADAVSVVRAAVDAGINLIDTAPVYGSGIAESRVASGLAAVARAPVVVSTKVGWLLRDDAEPDPQQMDGGEPYFKGGPALNPVADFSYEGTMRSYEESRERLGGRAIDLLHVHDPDHYLAEALAGAFPALAELRSRGDIAGIGIGMNQAPMIARVLEQVDLDVALLAGRYTLLDQSGLDEVLPLCARRGVAVLAGGVFNSGILADPRPGARFFYQVADEAVLARVDELGKVCERHGVPLAAAAIQFPLTHPAVTAVLTGPRTVAELTANTELAAITIPDELWHDLRREGLVRPDVPLPGDSPEQESR